MAEEQEQEHVEQPGETPGEPAAEATPEPEQVEQPGEAPGEPAAEAAPEPAEAEAPATEPKRKRKRLPRRLRPPRPKRRRAGSGERRPIVRLPKPERARGRRQERQGTVVSASADKTIVVRVDTVKAHPVYKKVIRRSTKLHAHDEHNRAKVGDIVRVVETRPLSRLKRWRLSEIVEEAK